MSSAMTVCVCACVMILSMFCQMRFLLLFSRQGKLRLQKWFTPMSEREKKKIIRDMTSMVLSRQPRSCNFLHWKDLKIIYKRWALPPACLNDFICFLGSKTPSFFSTHSCNCFVYNLYLLFVFLLAENHHFVTFSSGMPACISAWL